MKRAVLHLTLNSDLVFSASGATEGGHAGLPYIPGASLLGWAARHLYRALAERNTEDAFTVFHSGRVRFGNGVPLTVCGHPAYPMPQCFRQRKRFMDGIVGDGDGNERLNEKAVRNFQSYRPEGDWEGEQPEAIKEGFVAATGAVERPQQGYRMKTAIDDDTRRAATAELFGYQHVVRGSRFVACLEADADVDEELFSRIKKIFDGHNLRLGRSKAKEYGAVLCHVSEDDGLIFNCPSAAPDAAEVTIWLLSDLAINDDRGVPLLLPGPQVLGLPEGTLDPGKSFIATRRYWPFNAYLDRPDRERPVIAQGSILHFTLNELCKTTEFATAIGLYRECGLGRIWINPEMLDTDTPAFIAKTAARPGLTEQRVNGADSDPLVDWLNTQHAQASVAEEAGRLAGKWEVELDCFYKRAQVLAGVARPAFVGPSVSQWGRISEACARRPKDVAALRDLLFKEICRQSAGEIGSWEAVGEESGETAKTFRSWLDTKFPNNLGQDRYQVKLKALGTLAESARRIVRKMEQRQ